MLDQVSYSTYDFDSYDWDSYDSYSGYSGYDSSLYYPNYTTSSKSSSDAGGLVMAILGMGLFTWIITIALVVLALAGQWKTFSKAGKAGWEALIAGHNQFVMFELSGIKPYFIFLMFVPIANIIIPFWLNINFAKSYGKGAGFGVGLTLLPGIFFPILGFGKAQYVGPAYQGGDFSTRNNYNNNYNNPNNFNNNNNGFDNNQNPNNFDNNNNNNFNG